MAQFRAVIRGQRGMASRLGTKKSGLSIRGQTWGKDIIVEITNEPDSIAGSVDLARIWIVNHGESARGEAYDVITLSGD
jgi:hypothetical protein